MDVIGADELDEVLSTLGISGDDDDDGIQGVDADTTVGELIGRARRSKGKRSKVPHRQIVGMSAEGRPRQFPFLLSRSVALADAGSATLTGTADRRSLLTSLFLEANDAAGVAVLGLSLIGCRVNGRNAIVGNGFIPAGIAFGAFAQNAPPYGVWNFGVIDSGNVAEVQIQNDSGAAADVYGGFRAECTD